MHDEAERMPKIFQGYEHRLTITGPVHIHMEQGVSADDIILLTHLESRLKRSAARLKALDDKNPAQ